MSLEDQSEDPTGAIMAPSDGPYWRLDIHATPQSAPELMSRILAERPAWDLYTAPWGLSMRLLASRRDSSPASPIPAGGASMIPADSSSGTPTNGAAKTSPDNASQAGLSPNRSSSAQTPSDLSTPDTPDMPATGSPSPSEASPDLALPDFVLIRDVAAKLGRGKPLAVKTVLTWLPGESAAPIQGLGPFSLARPNSLETSNWLKREKTQETSETSPPNKTAGPTEPAKTAGAIEPIESPKTADAAAASKAIETAEANESVPNDNRPPAFQPPSLKTPLEIQPSPRLKTCLSLALTALASHLAPPPGAPETKGQGVLIFDENPAILSTAALISGSGPVAIISSHPRLAKLAKMMASLNCLQESPQILPESLPPWTRATFRAYADSFGLIVANHSVHMIVRALRALAAWLKPGDGKLIVTGVQVGAQSSYLVKAASRADLVLSETSVEGGWAVMTMSRRRPAKAAIWPWSPGDWLSELDEVDREALARIEALEKSGRRRGRPESEEVTVFGAANGNDLADDSSDDDVSINDSEDILINSMEDDSINALTSGPIDNLSDDGDSDLMEKAEAHESDAGAPINAPEPKEDDPETEANRNAGEIGHETAHKTGGSEHDENWRNEYRKESSKTLKRKSNKSDNDARGKSGREKGKKGRYRSKSDESL